MRISRSASGWTSPRSWPRRRTSSAGSRWRPVRSACSRPSVLSRSARSTTAAIRRGKRGWDAPRRVVATGPYRWVRNPIYIAALLLVLGEARLFLASALIAYAVVMTVFFRAFVTLYEEPTLRRHFGQTYQEYTGQPYPRGEERVVASVIPEMQRVGIG